MRARRITLVIAIAISVCVPPAIAQLKLGRAQRSGSLTDEKVSAGLKEALQAGITRAVNLTGRTDGFFKNEAIKIVLPEKMKVMERGLRAVGMGSRIDEFELSMNRAAEKAAPQAKSIFLDAMRQMTFDDARRILTGGDTAATSFFKETTTDRLTVAFLPIVEKTTAETGVTRQYKDLTGRANTIPFIKKDTLDIDHYVVGKALDGLFYMVGEEEKKIRKNPAAQVTSLLKEVFGKR